MFKNYLIIAWRNLFRQRLYAFINIGGLAIGLGCFMLIALYITYETSFDRDQDNHENVYRVYQQQHGNTYMGTDFFASMPAPLAKTMREEFPEVEQAVAFQYSQVLMNIDGQNFVEETGLQAETSFFSVFPNRFIVGNPETALLNPAGLVLTETLSKKHFGTVESLGESIFLNGTTFEVTGIVEDIPENSTVRYNFVQSIEKDENYIEQEWMNNSPYVFMVLKEGANVDQLSAKFPALLEKYQQDETYPFKNEYFVESLTDLHLSNTINGDFENKGNASFLYLMGLIAIVILLLASVNYMNLSVAQSVKRMKEVGVRKVVGAKRGQIIIQFLGESVLFSFLAMLVALIACYLILPSFSELIERNLEFSTITKPTYLVSLVLLLGVIGLFSGSYPALIISSLRPSRTLKGKAVNTGKKFPLEKSLIIFQYAASFILVIGGIVIFQQIKFIQNKDVGYTKEQIVTVPVKDDALRNDIDALRNEWLSNPRIIAVSGSDGLPSNIQSSTIINDENDALAENDLAIYHTRVDYDYLDVFGIELLTGRNFSKDFGTDLQQGYVLNETAAKALGWSAEEAIGKNFDHNGTETIIGVVKDFNMHSLHMQIEPLMISLGDYYRAVSIKVRPENLPETISYLETVMSKYSQYPFEYQFLDDRFDKMYTSEFRLGKAINYFSIIALLLASFGLFGLAAVVTEQKSKEIGIRKVLGASERTIVTLFANDFLKTVLVAFLLAIPVSWMFMEEWLNGFVYRIHIDWKIYVATGLAAITITLLTIGYQTLKAALANPVKSLRSE